MVSGNQAVCGHGVHPEGSVRRVRLAYNAATMPLAPGTKLGPYEIQSMLGAGGMGEVYRALDRRLDRTVAIKVLASHLISSPESKQRMDREARAISSLNHPHICHLYDIGSQAGTDYLVIEFLEGETLAARLTRGPVPLAEILKVGIAIAEALAAAHRQGIVHRDLKPGNIMLTPGGAKLMDFGLAKPVSAQASGAASGSVPSFTAAPTVSGPSSLTPLTVEGKVVGTYQYMSPEQIQGKEADSRSDIFALGAVLYEMAVGKRAFTGKSQLSLASAILEGEPQPVRAVKPQIPPEFEHMINTCLQKDPEERCQTAHDVKLQLQWIASGQMSSASGTFAVVAPQAVRRERLGWIAALVAVALLGAAGGVLLLRPPRSARVVRAAIDPPEKTTLNLVGDYAGPPVISPDGASIAFTATNADGAVTIWVKPVDSVEAHTIPGTDAAILPFWSPDSHSLGFFSNGKLKTVELNGGSPQVVCNADLGRGGAWGADGEIAFSPSVNSGLSRVSASGGAPTPLTTLDAAQHTSHRWPFFLPDGRHFLYLAMIHDAAKAANDGIYYASVDGKENRLLLRAQSNAVYAAGYILFARGDQLMAQAFDPASGKLSGEARGVAKGVMNDQATWHMDASAAGDGLLVYASGGSADLQLVWLDRSGKQIGTIPDRFANLDHVRISPQGDRAAMEIDTSINDVWVLDLARSVRTRFTFGPTLNAYPVWSPDGKWIAYASVREGHPTIVRRHSDGSGDNEVLTTAQDAIAPSDWSRDGKYIFFWHITPASNEEGIWVLPLEGDHKPRRVLERGSSAVLSPDGHWLAYNSMESGTMQVFVEGFGGAKGKWQVSAAAANTAVFWSADGKEIFFMDPNYNLLAVPVKAAGGGLQFGAPQTLAQRVSAPIVFFDVTPDGKRILLPKTPQQVASSVTVVTNFTAELKK